MRHAHILGLDALRLLSILLVMGYHFVFWNWVQGQPFTKLLGQMGPNWGYLMHFGWVGVEIFFVISGYVIAFSASATKPSAFIQNRIIRLVPANVICATIVLLCLVAAGSGSIDFYLPRYVQTLVFWPLNSIDGPWWTLGIEIAFYLLVYALLVKRKGEHLEKVMIFWSSVTLIFWICALSLTAILAQYKSSESEFLMYMVAKAQGNRILQLLLVQHGAFFALGVIIFNASERGLSRIRLAALIIVVPACLLEIVGQNGIIARSSQLILSPIPALVAWICAMGFLIASVRYNIRLTTLRPRTKRILRFSGAATYPLYLLHNGAGILIVTTMFSTFGNFAVLFAIIASIGLALLIAWVPEPAVRTVILYFWPKIDRQNDPVAHAQFSLTRRAKNT
ncbi:Peptidoglycan/LPS O-acetylase OafA/YrhL, contains acyltransferase and SGNH-hydrolase domains [Methylobacterium sp. 190mf]|uniref:acyltransferase family protein n=1 Tax=Methylobacterium sp. 190mf TaxID=1761798 RepID=UPI00089F394B|nr:acyltransferase [Methylobacterium sp. 190mf]SEG71250.1 Peptidoglycan/LPS O-acetylase OafA/YrhL, contains acyltransferase and SGNH-hydrolase domains [Methylobacterium sp. 190mf]